MFSPDALSKLQEAAVAHEAHAVLEGAGLEKCAVALPKEFQLVDLEKYQADRRRMRGAFTTTSIKDFMQFSDAEALSEGSSCFVDATKMTAKTILNLGNHEAAGHADFTAELRLEQTPEYKALLQITAAAAGQKAVAEWMEDWREGLSVTTPAGEPGDVKTAISAIRKIDIKVASKSGHSTQNLSTERSLLESVAAESEHGLPAEINFKCRPYKELAEREFKLRLAVLTGGDAPKISLHIRKRAFVEQEMAEEFSALLGEGLKGVAVYVGSYDPK